MRKLIALLLAALMLSGMLAVAETAADAAEPAQEAPVSYDVIYSSPQLRWDLYQAVGAPEIKDLNGLLDVLEEIHKIHPTEW